jgi:hypothetical protein
MKEHGSPMCGRVALVIDDNRYGLMCALIKFEGFIHIQCLNHMLASRFKEED